MGGNYEAAARLRHDRYMGGNYEGDRKYGAEQQGREGGGDKARAGGGDRRWGKAGEYLTEAAIAWDNTRGASDCQKAAEPLFQQAEAVPGCFVFDLGKERFL